MAALGDFGGNYSGRAGLSHSSTFDSQDLAALEPDIDRFAYFGWIAPGLFVVYQGDGFIRPA